MIKLAQLLGVYHWNEGLRSMHKHDDRLELNFILSGNGTQVILMLYSKVEAWCIAVKGLKLPGLKINELVPKNFHPRIPVDLYFSAAHGNFFAGRLCFELCFIPLDSVNYISGAKDFLNSFD